MIFFADGQPIYVGRAQRTVTKAQMLALYRRDRGCIDCGIRPQACEAHHITPWEHNGKTDIDNLVLLCAGCHRKVHKHGYTVSRDLAARKYRLLPPARPGPNLHPPPQLPDHQQTAA